MSKTSAVALAIVLSVAPYLSAAAQDDWAAVTAAAKKEGKVVFYTAEMGAACIDARIKDFQDRYGIKVDVATARVTELEARISVEQSTDRPIGDIYSSGEGGVHRAERQGRLQPHGVIPNASRLLPRFRGDQYEYDYEGILYGILANTDKIAAADLPKTWHDLLAPRWKGAILADDLTVEGIGLVTFTGLYHALGQDYMAQLAAQRPTFSREQGNDLLRTARGEFQLYFPFQTTYIPGLAGLPVTTLFPSDGVPYTDQALSILKTAPHPNAARLFMNHYLEPKWQTICSQGGAIRPAIEGVPVGPSAVEQQVAKATLLGNGDVDPQEQPTLTKLAKDLFNKPAP